MALLPSLAAQALLRTPVAFRPTRTLAYREIAWHIQSPSRRSRDGLPSFAAFINLLLRSTGKRRKGSQLMKALVYHGPGRKAWEHVPDPKIINPTDVIVQVDITTICGTDCTSSRGTSRP